MRSWSKQERKIHKQQAMQIRLMNSQYIITPAASRLQEDDTSGAAKAQRPRILIIKQGIPPEGK